MVDLPALPTPAAADIKADAVANFTKSRRCMMRGLGRWIGATARLQPRRLAGGKASSHVYLSRPNVDHLDIRKSEQTFMQAVRLQRRYGLLTNDSMIVATMLRDGIRLLATADR